MSPTTAQTPPVDSPASVTLAASRHRTSGRCVFPQVPSSSPASSRYEPITLSPLATLYSFTVIHPHPRTGEPPFVLAYADFAEQVRVFGRLDLPADRHPRVGMSLRVVSNEPIPAGDGSAPAYRFVAAEEAA